MAQPGYQQPQQQEEKHAKIGGILIVVGSALGLIFGLFYAVVGTALMSIPVAGSAAGAICYLPLIFSIVGIIGGAMAIMKKNFIFSIIGGILGLLSVGFVIGFILCLIGVILVGISKQDFKSTQQAPAQQQGPQQSFQQQQSQPAQQQQPTQQQEPAQPTAQEQENTCPDCGGEMRYIDEHDRWYCDNCEEYK